MEGMPLTLKSGLLRECGGAECALEWLLLGVDDGVRAQVGRAPERLAAGGAPRPPLHVLLARVLVPHVQPHP